MLYEHKDGIKEEIDIYDFQSDGVGLAYFNTFESIKDFAYSCFNFSIKRNFPLFLSTKNTILQKYDESFKEIFDVLYEKEFKKEFEKKTFFTSID